MDKEHFSTILPVSASDVDKIEILRDSLGIFDTAIFKEEFPKFLDLHNTSNIIRISHISQFTNDYHISREFDSEDSRDVKKNWYSSIEDSKFENEIDYEPQNPESRCPICLEEDVEFDTLGCSDKYCVSCITLVLENFINSMEVFPNQAKCYLCSHSISDETFKSHIHPDLYKRMLFLREKIHRDQLVASGQAIHCISLDCNGYAYLFDNELLTACIICRVSLCVGCKRGSHPTLTCEENQCRNPEDSIDEILFSRHWKRCPCCGVPVERMEGCNYIVCFSSICQGKNGLCYKCGKELDEDQHFSHYTKKGPYGDSCNTLDGMLDEISEIKQ